MGHAQFRSTKLSTIFQTSRKTIGKKLIVFQENRKNLKLLSSLIDLKNCSYRLNNNIHYENSIDILEKLISICGDRLFKRFCKKKRGGVSRTVAIVGIRPVNMCSSGTEIVFILDQNVL